MIPTHFLILYALWGAGHCGRGHGGGGGHRGGGYHRGGGGHRGGSGNYHRPYQHHSQSQPQYYGGRGQGWINSYPILSPGYGSVLSPVFLPPGIGPQVPPQPPIIDTLPDNNNSTKTFTTPTPTPSSTERSQTIIHIHHNYPSVPETPSNPKPSKEDVPNPPEEFVDAADDVIVDEAGPIWAFGGENASKNAELTDFDESLINPRFSL